MSTPSPSEPRPPEQPSPPPNSRPMRGDSAADQSYCRRQPASPAEHSCVRRRADGLLPELHESHLRSLPRRRVTLPLILFIATCLSTFWVGAANWRPQLIESTAAISATSSPSIGSRG